MDEIGFVQRLNCDKTGVAIVLEMVKGCKVSRNHLLSEQYEIQEYALIANVHAHKMEEILQHFIAMQTQRLFFILELPVSADDEQRLRKNDTDPMHKNIYYIDGLDADHARMLLIRYGDLLINDGMSSFGFGAHDGTAEIMLGKYNIVTLWTNTMDQYKDFFDAHQIPLVENLFAAWDTFTPETPGKCMRIEVSGKSVFDLPDELKDWGIYLAEQREE